MKKRKKSNHVRDWFAIHAHFKSAAGEMKNNKYDKKSVRREARKDEKDND